MIPYGRQEITEEDISEVEKVLRSDFLTQGPTVPKFEKSVADYCGTSYAVAVNSATSALHIACLALDLGPGDLLWTSPNTFVASANCGRYCGADIDFVDIDPKTYNMCVNALSKKLIKAEKLGKLPKILIPVHFAGQPCDMPSIYDLSKRYGFKIIEDASHAIGASYDKIKVGSCSHSDITVFSFHPVKIITTGEGGMALTNNKNVADKISSLRTHGITKDKKKMKKRPEDEIWNYQQIDLGFNYRMNDIQAALGLNQMKRLDEYIKRRHQIAKYYNSELRDLPLVTPLQKPENYSSYHLYPLRVKNNLDYKIQKQVYQELIDNKILVNLHYIPVHRHPYYENLGFKKNDFPEAEKFHQQAISIPMYAILKNEHQEHVIKTLKKIKIIR
ncbi:UDP-4-amino-4,6-dideoxy-N-acetyl-beta-L-altrosamine transaminase [Candidatus Pelagibacter sp.]|nr:UDP-4-amino-4,6-dideoxy-N-acetyl-beta-L-altrosamine transaminase [Candidatus Pelagibacter sp.]MDA9199964.1 UDP-4-amino-4,6-dideoxy-N-acetyl-beta-L-altrosamine transaminase [Candidatus Pelagibacter sp.]